MSEDATTRPAIVDSTGFNVAYVGAESDNGSAMHTHPEVEVFIPISGQWAIYWNEGDAAEEVVIGIEDQMGAVRKELNAAIRAADPAPVVVSSDTIGDTRMAHAAPATAMITSATANTLIAKATDRPLRTPNNEDIVLLPPKTDLTPA